tara:strand:- start:3796 stop:6174 length:2379 start_codon:yes stop_codon:yes gene_type:complete
MGLMKLNGDIYNFYGEEKLAQAEPMLQDSISSPTPGVTDQMPAPVDAPLGKPEPPPLPKSNEPPQVFSPPMGNNLQGTLPPMVRTAEDTAFSRLKKAIDTTKSAQFTESDFSEFYGSEEQLPEYSATPSPNVSSDIVSYTPAKDYSNYMAASAAPALVGSPDSTASGFSGPQEFSPMEVEPSPQPEVSAAPAAPAAAESPYNSIQKEIVDYLVGMGYSPEEAAVAAPRLLADVNVTSPTEKVSMQHSPDNNRKQALFELIKLGYSPEEALYVVNSSEDHALEKEAAAPVEAMRDSFLKIATTLVSDYVDSGYSPFQARQMAITVVVPQAEKYASTQSRVIGGLAGAGLGALSGDALYDDGSEYGGSVVGALLGGAAGAAAGGRVPQYFRKGYDRASGVGKELLDDAINLQATNRQKAFKDLQSLAKTRGYGGQNITSPSAITSAMTPAERSLPEVTALSGVISKADQNIRNLGDTTHSAFDDLVSARIKDIRAEDAKAIGGLAAVGGVPIYLTGRALDGSGKENYVDSTIDTLSDAATDATDFIVENPEYLAGAAGLGLAAKGGQAAYEHYKGRSKKASQQPPVPQPKPGLLSRALTGTVKGIGKGISKMGPKSALTAALLSGAGTGIAYQSNKDDFDDINLPGGMLGGAAIGGGLGLLANRFGGKHGAKTLLGLSAAVPAGYYLKRKVIPNDDMALRRDTAPWGDSDRGEEGPTWGEWYEDKTRSWGSEDSPLSDRLPSTSPREILDSLSEGVTDSGNWIQENPYQAAALATGVLGAGYGAHKLLNDPDIL